MYELFEHTADLGLRIRNATREGLFADAARGLFSMMVTNLDGVKPVLERTYDLEGDVNDYLLFDWLNELLYTFEAEKILLARFDVSFDERGLHASARGELMELSRHEMDHEVKAVTYHQLRVERVGAEWLAEVIVDI